MHESSDTETSDRGTSSTGTSTDPPDLAKSIMIDDTEYTAEQDDQRRWSYRPSKIILAENGTGGRQLSVIEAGSFAMVSLTTQLGPDAAALEAARSQLADLVPCPAEQIVLTAAQVEVGEVSLLVGDGAEQYQPLATTASSGAPPYSAVFSMTLTPEQLVAVKKALAGEVGWLAARYAVTEPVPPVVDIDETTTSSSSYEHTSTTTVVRNGKKTSSSMSQMWEQGTPCSGDASTEEAGPLDEDLPPTDGASSGTEPETPVQHQQVTTIHTDAATWASTL